MELPWAQRAKEQATEGRSQAWAPNGICFAGFQTCLGPVTSEFLPFSPYPCILKTDDLFSSITGPQIERRLAPE